MFLSVLFLGAEHTELGGDFNRFTAKTEIRRSDVHAPVPDRLGVEGVELGWRRDGRATPWNSD